MKWHGCGIKEEHFDIHQWEDTTITIKLDNFTCNNFYCYPDSYILLCSHCNFGTELSKWMNTKGNPDSIASLP